MNYRVVILAIAASVPLLCFADDLGDDLLAAARKGDIAAVKSLLDKGADVNSKSPYGSTPLFFASERGHTEIVRLLLDKGADPNAKDTFYNATALTWAASKDRTEIVKLLLAKGAEGVDMLLTSAVQSGNKDLMKIALDTGKVKQNTLNFCLSMAMKANKPETAEMLKKAGAQPPAAPAAAITVDPAVLARYAGKYQGGRGGTEFDYILAVVDGKLAVTSPRSLTLVPISQTRFRTEDNSPVEVEFVMADGKVTSATFGPAGAQKIELKKVN